MSAANTENDPIYDITPLMPSAMRDAIPVFTDTMRVLHDLNVPFVVFGGIAMLEYGRTRVTKDIDFLVSKQNAIMLIDKLPKYGYRTQRTDDNWVYHAFKSNQIMDLLFALGKGFLGDPEGVVLDDDVLARARWVRLDDTVFPVASPADLIHSKLLVSWKESRQEDFQDVLLIIRNAPSLDWDDLFNKISRYPVRTLAMLSYAASCQITEDVVPSELAAEMEELSRHLFRALGRAA